MPEARLPRAVLILNWLKRSLFCLSDNYEILTDLEHTVGAAVPPRYVAIWNEQDTQRQSSKSRIDDSFMIMINDPLRVQGQSIDLFSLSVLCQNRVSTRTTWLLSKPFHSKLLSKCYTVHRNIQTCYETSDKPHSFLLDDLALQLPKNSMPTLLDSWGPAVLIFQFRTCTNHHISRLSQSLQLQYHEEHKSPWCQ